jgi:hypothetical protein
MNTTELLELMTQKIRSGQILSPAETNVPNYDDVIGERDSVEFERQWLSQFNALEQRSKDIDFNESEAINGLREAAYKAAFGVTESPDIAAFVSDDFELIGRAIALNVNDPWINGLWINYKNNNIHPNGIVGVAGDLRSLVS